MIHERGTEKNLEGAVLNRRGLLLGAAAAAGAALVASCKPIKLPPPETTKGTETPSSAETSPAAWPDTASPSSSAETSKEMDFDNLTPESLSQLVRDVADGKEKRIEAFIAIRRYMGEMSEEDFKDLNPSVQLLMAIQYQLMAQHLGSNPEVQYYDTGETALENMTLSGQEIPRRAAEKIENILRNTWHLAAYSDNTQNNAIAARVLPTHEGPWSNPTPDTGNSMLMYWLKIQAKNSTAAKIADYPMDDREIIDPRLIHGVMKTPWGEKKAMRITYGLSDEGNTDGNALTPDLVTQDFCLVYHKGQWYLYDIWQEHARINFTEEGKK